MHNKPPNMATGALIGAVIFICLAWAAGFNFASRGLDAVFTSLIVLLGTLIGGSVTAALDDSK